MDIVVKKIIDLIGPKHGGVKELADAIKVHPNVITAWKNGSLKSYRKYLPQIANYFGVPVEYFTDETFIKTEEKTPAPMTEQERLDEKVLELLHQHSLDAQSAIIDLLARMAVKPEEK